MEDAQNNVSNEQCIVKDETMKPGKDYCNWVLISKQKLKVRENKLLEIKITKIELIVNEQLKNNQCNGTVFLVTQIIINNTINKLHNLIDKWNGVALSRIKTALKRYKDYFKIAKSWYDQTKKQIFGALFWLPIFKHIHKCIDHKPDSSHLILLNIINALFCGTVKYANTKAVRLINAGTLICSDEMQKYLFSLDNSLEIEKWVQQYSNSNQKAMQIMTKIQTQFVNLINNNGKETNKTDAKPTQIARNSVYKSPLEVFLPENVTPKLNQNINPISIPTVVNINNNYINTHGISYQSSNLRYSPMFPNVPPQTQLPFYLILPFNIPSNHS